ncbi:MAG: hypothetical protein ACUVQQ_09455 [Thermogutta sp.]
MGEAMKLRIASFFAAVVILAYGVGQVTAQTDAERRPSFLDRIGQRLSEGLAPKRSPAETMTAAEGPARQGMARAGSAAAPSSIERPTIASSSNAPPGIEPMPEPELDSPEPSVDSRVPLHQKLHRYRTSPFAVQSVPVWTVPQSEGAASRDAAESPGDATMGGDDEVVASGPTPAADVRVPTATIPTTQRGPVSADVSQRPSALQVRPSASAPVPDRSPPARTLGEHSASAPAAAAATGPSMRPTLAPPEPQAGLVQREPRPSAEQTPAPMPAASPNSVERPHERYVPALAGRSVANQPASVADAAAPESRSLTAETAARSPAAESGRPTLSVENEDGRGAVSQARAAETPTAASKTAGDRVLINRTTPLLNVETIGPRRITVGREGLYTLQLKNQGQTPAKQVIVHVLIPNWAELSGAEPTDGTVAQQMEGDFRHLAWRIEELPASAAESLDLRIIPRASKPFDLAVQWEFAPPPTQASIEVQEPKLELRLDGPETILFGQTQVYRLEVENSGTGDAENVTLTLVPPGSTGREVIRHTLGTIPAGAKRVVELELVARQEGALGLVVDARDDLAATAHLERTVTVLKPALEVVVQGPPMQYVGQEDWYEVTVRNPGTAPAEDVRVAVSLPSAVSLVAAPQGELEDKHRAVRWTLDNLPPGKEAKFRLACRYELPGTVRLAANAEGKNLAAQGEWLTKLETIADLALRVEDPQGPVPIGKPAEYRIILENRGTRAAEKVQVVGFFSEGIEATAADGAPNKILPGQVLFSPIRAIAPGEKAVLTIRAVASKHGHLVFRAEASCPTGNIQLAAEESTYFFDVMVAGKEGETLQR